MEPTSFSPLGMLSSMNWLAKGVVVVLVLMSIWSLTIAIERETLMTTAEMKKGLGNLATISTTAPFVGLFGTVAGIIHAFQGMALSGSGGLGAVSAGSAEALVATV